MRKLVIAGIAMLAVIAAMLAVTLMHTSHANAASTTVSTQTTAKTMVNSHCYRTVSHETEYYHWSSKTGWTRYVSPAHVNRSSVTCH